MVKRNVLHATRDGDSKIVFSGIDWGQQHATTIVRCPRCSTDHTWVVRRPKRCRRCEIKFVYTASEAAALSPS